jgi:ribosomal protein S14
VRMTVQRSAWKPLSDSSLLSYRCQFCGRPCGVFSRLDFLRERRR